VAYNRNMYNHAPTDYDCPLCHIAKGEDTERGNQEETVVFRNDLVTAFIAGRFQRSDPGHVIVIPNEHFENIYDMPEEYGHAVFDAAKKVAIAFKEVYESDGVSTMQHNEPAGNQDAFHYHFHVFPRTKGDEIYANQKDSYWATQEEKIPYAEKLRAYFAK